MRRRRFLAAAGAAASTSLAGCTALGSGDDFDVGMTAVAFDPAEVTVSAGETVVWRNTSSRMHTVTAYESLLPDGAAFFASSGKADEAAARAEWRDAPIRSGDSYSYTFDTPGTYEYFCIPHEKAGMVGTVVVEG
jgi:plastocyanin